MSSVLLNFLSKYFFILKAAADGWRVSYVGGNKFEFYKNNNCTPPQNYQDHLSPNDFVKKYIRLVSKSQENYVIKNN
jgi:hypothetical protein